MGGRRSRKEGSPPNDWRRSWVEDGAPRRGGKEESPLGREVVFLGHPAGVGRRTLGGEVGVFLEGWEGGLMGGRWESEVLSPVQTVCTPTISQRISHLQRKKKMRLKAS